MAFRILTQEFAGGIEMGVLADTGENIRHFAAVRLGVLHSVRGQKRETKLLRQINQPVVNFLFATHVMSLEFYINIFLSQGFDQELCRILRAIGDAASVPWEAGCFLYRNHARSEERHQAIREYRQITPPNGALSFCAAQMRLG